MDEEKELADFVARRKLRIRKLLLKKKTAAEIELERIPHLKLVRDNGSKKNDK